MSARFPMVDASTIAPTCKGVISALVRKASQRMACHATISTIVQSHLVSITVTICMVVSSVGV